VSRLTERRHSPPFTEAEIWFSVVLPVPYFAHIFLQVKGGGKYSDQEKSREIAAFVSAFRSCALLMGVPGTCQF
jgi:hypothetical protein